MTNGVPVDGEFSGCNAHSGKTAVRGGTAQGHITLPFRRQATLSTWRGKNTVSMGILPSLPRRLCRFWWALYRRALPSAAALPYIVLAPTRTL